jgi:hypothetical protein
MCGARTFLSACMHRQASCGVAQEHFLRHSFIRLKSLKVSPLFSAPPYHCESPPPPSCTKEECANHASALDRGTSLSHNVGRFFPNPPQSNCSLRILGLPLLASLHPRRSHRDVHRLAPATHRARPPIEALKRSSVLQHHLERERNQAQEEIFRRSRPKIRSPMTYPTSWSTPINQSTLPGADKPADQRCRGNARRQMHHHFHPPTFLHRQRRDPLQRHRMRYPVRHFEARPSNPFLQLSTAKASASASAPPTQERNKGTSGSTASKNTAPPSPSVCRSARSSPTNQKKKRGPKS